MKERGNDLIVSMFLPAAAVMIFTQLSGVVANIIDGVVTSRCLGADAYSSVSLLAPMVNMILLFASFISIGGQIVCSNKIGRGEREEANAVFSFSILFGILITVIFILLCVFVPGVLFRLCGVSVSSRPELYENMLDYMHGYLIGIPAVIMTQVLSPYLVMDSGKRLVSLSATMLCAADIAGDILNVTLLHGGVFGMGAATAVSLWLQLLVLSTHFVKKNSFFRFSPKGFTLSHFREVVKNGSLTFLKRLATIVRDIGTNRINLIVAVSTAAVAAKGMQSDLNMLMFSIGIGIGHTLLTVASMYYGAGDKEGLKRSFSYAIKLSFMITVPLGAILFFAAPLISRFYTNEAEVISFSVFSIRCMALGLPLDALTEIFQDYLQGIQKRKIVNAVCFAERLFIPLAAALVLGTLFGSRGVMASIAVGKVLLIALVFLNIFLKSGGKIRNIESYMFLEKLFGGKESDNLTAQISNMDDVIRESERAAEFCKDHGCSPRQSYLTALFVEEMAGNIVKHGRPNGRSKVPVDYRIYTDGENISISLRDFCEQFDPMNYYEIYQESRRADSMGIRLVMELADDIRYVYTFNTNCIFINLGVRESGSSG